VKKNYLLIVFSLFFISLFAQEPELGLPGDNLNLYGVLDIFQKSATLEEFEKSLNAEDNKVNNLDLNGDGKIDYIHVVDHVTGSAHAIALQVDINETETQDVAVIEVEREINNKVHVQIVGDEALYGKDYIIEPNQRTANSADNDNGIESTTYYYPDAWVIFGYIFDPSFLMYVSPYHWGYYPQYWQPWVPLSTFIYYGFHRPYFNYYRRSETYRSPNVHAFYFSHRASSVTFREKYPSSHENNPLTNHSDVHKSFPPPTNHSEYLKANRSSNNRTEPTKMVRSSKIPAESPKTDRSTNNRTETHKVNQTQHGVNEPPVKTYQAPKQNIQQPTKTYQAPQQTKQQPSRTYQAPRQTNQQPTRTYQAPRQTIRQPVRTYQAPRSSPSPVKKK
jgi:hypothetical protein